MRALVAGTSVLATAAVLAVAAPTTASAPAKASVTVTIKAENTDLSGVLKSSKPLKCAADRTVWVWKQKGARGGGDDVKSFHDTTSLQGGKYVWSTGNTGVQGKFYAKVKAKPGCRKDSSPTVRARRSD